MRQIPAEAAGISQYILGREFREELMTLRTSILLSAAIVVAAALVAPATRAQTSTSYSMSEHVFNEGGHPIGATTPASASFKISLGSIGDGLAITALGSASYRMDAGFVPEFGPPDEVLGVRILGDHKTIVWNADPSVGVYNVYRGTVSGLPGGFGTCWSGAVAVETIVDPIAAPGIGTGASLFYLVTAKNRLAEEGTKGFTSAHVERANATPCP